MLYRILFIFGLIAATIAYSIYSNRTLTTQIVSGEKSETILTHLPKSEFTTLEGASFKLDEFYAADKPGLVIVHFWGTWCAPCEAELPELMSLIKQFEDRPEVKFLLVAVNDEALKVSKKIKSLPLPRSTSLYWLLDNGNFHRDSFGTTRVPETYVFSSTKATLKKFIGPQEWNKTMFFQTFNELLKMSTTHL
jgi:cytochrome c biogenesis protein CcmG, thiol:disulfide interchange protein DsbE